MWLLVCHRESGTFRERIRKPKAPEKTYLGSGQETQRRTKQEELQLSTPPWVLILLSVELSEAQTHLLLHSSIESQIFSS